VQVTLTPIIDEEGKVEKMVAIDSDISKIKEAERKIAAQRDTLETQKDKLEIQNYQIRSSIQYAKTIQNAILPVNGYIEQFFNFFAIYRPKDIVSGDFYWFSEIETADDKSYIFAVIDCTGHGVPGAFMSMIGNSLLNEIIKVKEIYDPKEILDVLDQRIRISLNQDHTDNHDGMDVCLCRIQKVDAQYTKVIFAGAKRPLYYFRQGDKEISLLNGDRKSIGGIRLRRKDITFTNQEVVLSSGDCIYLSTDGLIDQNSPDRRRFGSNRLLSIMIDAAHKNMMAQKQMIENELDKYRQNEEQRDDITLIGVEIN